MHINSKKNKATTLAVLCIVFFVIVFFIIFFVTKKTHHKCIGINCTICLEIEDAKQRLKKVGNDTDVVFLTIIAMFLTLQVVAISNKISIVYDTLVSLKVKSTN